MGGRSFVSFAGGDFFSFSIPYRIRGSPNPTLGLLKCQFIHHFVIFFLVLCFNF